MNIGDIVNLKHGGALMTVIAVENGMITAMWTDKDLVPHQVEVPEESLEPTEFDED